MRNKNAKVKICGVTNLEDALMCVEAGADLLGLNFYKKSPRYLETNVARDICDALREQLGDDCPTLVGVFANSSENEVVTITNEVGLDFAQLSGDESIEMMKELRGISFKGIRPMNKAMALDDVQYFQPHFPNDERAPSLLIDAYHPKLYGGTGEQASTEVALAVKAEVPRLMLAGGLKPDNVAERIQAIQPWGVDVASGVEVDGEPTRKSRDKVMAFIKQAKQE